VKGYPNSEIAGFPRKKFKFYVQVKFSGVEHFIDLLSKSEKTPNTLNNY